MVFNHLEGFHRSQAPRARSPAAAWVGQCSTSVAARRTAPARPDLTCFLFQRDWAHTRMVGANLILLACLSFAAGQVFETQEIKHGDCTGVCGTLKLTTESGEEVEFHETNKKVKVKNVVKARVVGDGCFLIHKSTNFRSSQFLVEGKVNEYLLKDHISWTTVK